MTVIINGTNGVTFPNGATQATAVSAPATVAQGGTGSASLTANNVLLGNGTSALQVVAPGTSGNVLTSDGTTWASSALPAGGVTSLNGATGAITTTTAYALGSFIMGRPANLTSYVVGDTIAGSSLYAVASGVTWDAAPNWRTMANNTLNVNPSAINTGSWRCVSPSNLTSGLGAGLAGLWVRYA
jgi:hypothetical protein